MIETIFKNNILEYNMLSNGDNIVVALSGGADSILLITLLSNYIKTNNISVNVTAVHINHSLRDESDSDEIFCKNYTKELGFSFYSKKVDLYSYKEKHKVTIEEAGRLIRYKTFNEIYEKCKIFLGHNKDDSIETLILNLTRGSGTKGLLGIAPVQKNIYRPLLSFSKEEIYSYLNHNKIDFVEDVSNKENIYARNLVRNKIAPILKEINSMYLDNITKTQSILKEEDDYLSFLAIDYFQKVKFNDTALNQKKFNDLNTVIKKRILRHILNKSFTLTDIQSKHIDLILKLSNNTKGTKSIDLPQNIIVQSCNNCMSFMLKSNRTETDFYYKLTFDKIHYIEEINKYIFISINNNADYLSKIIKKENNLKLTIVKSKKFLYNGYNVIIRSKNNGDKIFLSSLNGTKKIKKYFIDEKIPKDIRNSIPLLSLENSNEILWILDEKDFVNGHYLAEDNLNNINIFIMEE